MTLRQWREWWGCKSLAKSWNNEDGDMVARQVFRASKVICPRCNHTYWDHYWVDQSCSECGCNDVGGLEYDIDQMRTKHASKSKVKK